MSFNKRKQWEGMFEDGVIVEGIETGEAPSALLTEVSIVVNDASLRQLCQHAF